MELLIIVFIIVVIGIFLSTLISRPAPNKPTAKVKQEDDPFNVSAGKAGCSMPTLFLLDEFIDGGGRNLSRQHEEIIQPVTEQFVNDNYFADDFEDDFEFFE